MNDFSGNTRVTLTARGWLVMAEEALAGIERTSNKKQSAQLRRKAKHKLLMGLVSLERERPLAGRRRPRNLPRFSQGSSQ